MYPLQPFVGFPLCVRFSLLSVFRYVSASVFSWFSMMCYNFQHILLSMRILYGIGLLLLRLSLQACGIPFETLLAVDRKPAAIKKAQKCKRHCVGHFFNDMDSAINREGPCSFHGGLSCKVARSCPDVVVAGLNCHPWTTCRTNKAVCEVWEHKDFNVVMCEWFEYLEVCKPKGGIIEEVWAFDTAMPDHYREAEGTEQKTYLGYFLEKLGKLSYAYVVFDLDNQVWYTSPKRRQDKN
jgi:site-specific DNA-cytosine methylase